MGGVDAIAFIGRHRRELLLHEGAIVDGLECMNAKIDPRKTRPRGVEADVTASGSKVKIFVIPTNEVLMIARDTMDLVNG
jgi:acetate kinase